MHIKANNPGKMPLQPHFTSSRHLHSQCSGMQASYHPHITEHRGVQPVMFHVSSGYDTESSRCCSCSYHVTAVQDKPTMHSLLGPPYLAGSRVPGELSCKPLESSVELSVLLIMLPDALHPIRSCRAEESTAQLAGSGSM